MKTDYQNIPEDAAMESRLWNYIDGLCDADEQRTIEKLIADNTLWSDKYAALLAMHQLISEAELEQPSMRFTKNVMEAIANHTIAPAAKEYINKKIIRSIAAFFIITLTGFLIYAFADINWSAAGSSRLSSDINATTISFTKIFNTTYTSAFIMLNIVLGLMLLDRYVTNKKAKHLKRSLMDS